MSKWTWYVNRLKAMNLQEVVWRLEQKKIQMKEKRRFGGYKVAVSSFRFNKTLEKLRFDCDALGIYFGNRNYSLNTSIHLLGGYDYNSYKKDWTVGFQTKNCWGDEFSYHLNYKQRDDIGDARTNWELNRHFQLALVPKAYFVSGDRQYADSLEEFFTDCNENNSFLHGISWTSAMEVAIRCIQWTIALSFLQKKGDILYGDLMENMETGIVNMTDYLCNHYSRFSSANNHLLVEAAAIALSGFVFHHQAWQKLAVGILSEELPKQNYKDGVNKELSLHYQTFGMEAYGIVGCCMLHNGVCLPDGWKEWLGRMCEFVSHCCWREQAVCEFGDNDEGKIVDLVGGHTDHYNYALQLLSLVLGMRYHSFEKVTENVGWWFSSESIDRIKSLPIYDNSRSRCFSEGGNSFLRSSDGSILIGIDHAALGFGTIAAHGHADALSFQILKDGKRIFTDPGTYIYHCQIEERNIFRRTDHHNTVMINGEEQSQVLGAFLWGKKAETKLLSYSFQEDVDELTASVTGLCSVVHTRTFRFGRSEGVLLINDRFDKDCDWTASFVIARDYELSVSDRRVTCDAFTLESCEGEIRIEDIFVSEQYGIKEKSKVIRIRSHSKSNDIKISINLL